MTVPWRTSSRISPPLPAPGLTPTTDTGRRTSAPRAHASSSSAGSSADRSSPTAGSPPRSAPYVRRIVWPLGVSTRIAGMGRATASSTVALSPSARSSSTAAGDANTPPACHVHDGRASRMTTLGPAAATRAANADPAGPPPTTATSTRSTRSPSSGPSGVWPGASLGVTRPGEPTPPMRLDTRTARRTRRSAGGRPPRGVPASRPACTPAAPTTGRRGASAGSASSGA